MQSAPVSYHEYLSLNSILNAQHLESDRLGMHAHDEMLFIVTHQTYELWFKQLLYELDSIIEIMEQPYLSDNAPSLQIVVQRLQRMVTMLRLLVQQIDIIETMTPMDFLDFRDMLRPASGFQSWQFKLFEARLGLQFEARHGAHHYTSQLREEHIQIIKAAESKPTLIKLINSWLERMPLYYPNDFWENYRNIYKQSLAEGEMNNLQAFDVIFSSDNIQRTLSSTASKAALFILLYRGYPMLQLPFQLLHVLPEIDEQLSTWRYRHIHMVQRVIGTRHGTGGSSGGDYLQGALNKHYIFKEFAQLNSFLIERRHLSMLPKEVESKLGFYT